MNRSLVAALAIASLAAAAACGGGGSHSTPATPTTANANSGATAPGKLVLSIPNASPAGKGRTTQFVSSAAVSATVAINGGTATVYDLTAASSNCTGGPTTRTCTLAITSVSGTISVTITLFDAAGGMGNNLGSATGTATVTAPTPFSMTIDINPAIKTLVSKTITFANGLPTITYKQAASGTMTMSFADTGGVTIPATNTSQFFTPVTIMSSDPQHVTFSPSTITNASQTTTVMYDGSPSVASSVMITMQSGTNMNTSFSIKTAGFLTEFAAPGGAGSQPSGIAKGPDGNIWFTESFSNKIGRVTIPANTIVDFPIPTASTEPIAIAAGPAGDTRMWFTEGSNTAIATIDTGTPVAQETPVGVSNWHGLTSFGANVFELNGNNNDVEKFDSSRNFVGTTGSIGTPGCGPNSVAAGPDNMLWVTCSGENEIYIVDPGTLGVTSVSINPTSPVIATGIAAGPDSAMWFAETSANMIGRIAIPGHTYTEFPIPTGGAGPTGIAQGPDGAMWFAEGGANKIGRIDVTTHQIVEFAVTATGGIPLQIVAGPDGWLWFTEFGTGLIGRMQPPI